MAALTDRAASCADAGRLDRVPADREAVPTRPLPDPGVEVAVGDLDDEVAALADEVMVMSFAAEAVAGLAGMVAERIDRAARAECRERPVDRRETDPLALGGEGRVDLLRGRVVPLVGEDAEDGKPLASRPQAVPQKELDGIRLRPAAHVPYASDR